MIVLVDLKSLPLAECQFESGRGTTKLMSKLLVISDKNKKSIKLKNLVFKEIKNFKNQFTNIVIVIGGDGFMLQTLKKIKIKNSVFMELTQVIMVF